MGFLNTILTDTEFQKKFAIMICLLVLVIAMLLKLAKIATYLFYKDWVFTANFNIEPLIKLKSSVLSWSLQILLSPVYVTMVFALT